MKLEKKKFKVNPEINIVVNKFDARHKLGFAVIKSLNDEYGDLLCETFVSVTKQLENSLAQGKCVWSSKGKNNALEDMHNLLIELLGLDSWKTDWKKQKLVNEKTWKRQHGKLTKKVSKTQRRKSNDEASL